jgi:hypothetical protein
LLLMKSDLLSLVYLSHSSNPGWIGRKNEFRKVGYIPRNLHSWKKR